MIMKKRAPSFFIYMLQMVDGVVEVEKKPEGSTRDQMARALSV